MRRLVLSGAEVWGDGGDRGDKEKKSCFSSQQSTVNTPCFPMPNDQ